MSCSWKRLANLIQDSMDSEEKTIEETSPMVLAFKENAEDNPTWGQAMNGADRDVYWTAAEEEFETLEKKDAWEVVSREDWMKSPIHLGFSMQEVSRWKCTQFESLHLC